MRYEMLVTLCYSCHMKDDAGLPRMRQAGSTAVQPGYRMVMLTCKRADIRDVC